MEDNPNGMDRRTFLKALGAAGAGGVLAELGVFDRVAHAVGGSPQADGRRPNILFILVDELRFPTAFPAGITTPAQFLSTFMPNLYQLWQRGVKFESYYTAGMACSPARAAIVTGLYPHQEWLLATRTAAGPSLNSAFPTYGKVLRTFGYETPYFGKWHLSNPPSDPSVYLEDYGFDGKTIPDPTGTNGQGAAEDPNIANQAVSWLQGRAGVDTPFCATVSFVNPHDTQYFWAGTEGNTYEALFAGQTLKPLVTTYQSVPGEDNPPSYGYPPLPANWESGATLQQNKPLSQTMFRVAQQAVWGGANDDPAATTFSVQPYPLAATGLGIGVAPFNYWQRGRNAYTYIMTLVDAQIGRVVAAIPPDQLANTVIVFASDHGEFNGAHGFLSGKIGTFYEEAWHIPLIVVDPSGRYTRQIDQPRQQLVSSVDLMPLLVTLGNRGSLTWKKGELAQIYGERLNLLPLLLDPLAQGRDHVLFASDEIPTPATLNYLHAPLHLLGVRTAQVKLGTYSHWVPGTSIPVRESMELEFYDYATAGGRSELENRPDDPRARVLLDKLFTEYVPQQMEARLPPALQAQSRIARESYLAYVAVVDALSISQLIQGGQLAQLLGYGVNF